jgi:hypothetical protein
MPPHHSELLPSSKLYLQAHYFLLFLGMAVRTVDHRISKTTLPGSSQRAFQAMGNLQLPLRT